MKTLKLFSIVAIVVAASNVFAQQSQQKIDMVLDRLGNSKVTISMKLPASEWQIWLANYGNNPAALKREIERSMPAYILDNFELQKQDMERSFALSFDAYGICKVSKRGEWSIDFDEKNAQVTKLTDHKFMYVTSPQELGGAVQQTFLIEFPAEARNIKTEKDTFGNSIFTFRMDEPRSGGGAMRWAGLALFVIGGCWTGGSMLKKKE